MAASRAAEEVGLSLKNVGLRYTLAVRKPRIFANKDS